MIFRYFLIFICVICYSCQSNKTEFVSQENQELILRDQNLSFGAIEDAVVIAELRIDQLIKNLNAENKSVLLHSSDILWNENTEIYSVRPQFVPLLKKIARNKHLSLVLVLDRPSSNLLLQAKNHFYELGLSSANLKIINKNSQSLASQITAESLLVYLGSHKESISMQELLHDSPLFVNRLKTSHILLPENMIDSTSSASLAP